MDPNGSLMDAAEVLSGHVAGRSETSGLDSTLGAGYSRKAVFHLTL
jgi:hypothetical protein